MKAKTLLAVAALMVLAIGADAQVKTAPPKTGAKKTTPMRDPKTGRFVKKSTTAKKTTPLRDPKTGRFIKTHEKGKSTAKRDPKTGRFIKGQ